MLRNAATGVLSNIRTTAVCSCGGPFNRYAMPVGWASEPILSLVPYEDGCVTPTQPYSVTQARAGLAEDTVGPTSHPQPMCISQVSTDLTVILTKTITGPVSAIALSPLRVQCHRRYPRCLLSQVSETRTLLLKLMGSDPQAPPAQWEVVSGLEPWLTINGFHVSTALPGALPGAKRATAVVVAPLFRSQGLTYII